MAHILTDAAPAILLADNVGCAALGEEALSGLTVLDPNTLPDKPDSNPQVTALTAQHLAYVIYTSGSTGTPKGVMVEHRGLINLVRDKIAQFDIHSDSRILQFASLSFDASVWEIMMALGSGACLVIAVDIVRQDPLRLWHYLEQQVVTHACLTPALLRDGGDLPALTITPTVILGGEAPSAALFQTLCRRAALFNAYGPTEITVCAATWRCPPDYTDTLVPIGHPTANTQIYLLNSDGQPVPLGAVGELYVGGAGVARGYLNRPELTAERFLADPFSEMPGARMYRTGDLARYLPDGNLVFVGRNDQQIKIRGFRIEPGEIETRLTEYPAVREAVVLARGEEHDKRLVAWVVAEENDELANSLRTHLSTILPDYMMPAAFVRLDALPLTPNGKLDRLALPAPDEEAFSRQIYEAPQGETEIALAAIWRELLGIELVGRYDSFFALGGHSLLAVRMINRMAALGIELPLTTLFKSPTLADFAEVMRAQLGEQNNSVSAMLPISREGALPLSFAQQRLWLLTQFEGVSQTYHVPMALRLHGQLDIAAWQQALNRLFARHEALRSIFISEDGQPQVELLPAELGLPMSKHDLRKVFDADKRLERLCVQEAEVPFDLAGGPLIRAGLIQRADDDYVFLLTQHHIVSDGWSAGVLMHELSALYTAFSMGLPDPLPPLAIQYPDYAAWQRQWLSAERLQIQSDYWRMSLADAPVLLDLPTDRSRPSQQSFAGALLPVNLDAELTQSLKRLSEQQGVTLFMTLLAAWATVLSRLSGQEDLVIGTPSAGRSRQEVESLIGFFVNTLALRMDLSDSPNVAELLARVRQTALAAQEHQDLPFEQVVEIVQPPRHLAHTPLFQVMFAWQNNEGMEWKMPGLTVSPAEQRIDIAKFDLELSLSEVDGRIVGYLNYATALFDQLTIERQVGYLHTVLREMAANPQQPVGKIDILTVAERKLLLETWNATQTRYPDQTCIHRLFEQQEEKTPDAVALVYEEHILSYTELNARANRLARQLIKWGIRSDERVAVLLERSIELIVAQLAILKAGAVYVPIDPRVPDERKNWLINDCSAKLLLSGIPVDVAIPRFSLTDEMITIEEEDHRNLDLPRSSTDLAYIMYTSGSTGTPKGVMVPHRAVVRLVINNGYAEIGPDDRVVFEANPAFDASTFEVWAPLLNGGTLVVIDHTTLLTPKEFVQALQTYRITVLWLSVGLFNRLATALFPVLPQIKTLIVGGDVLDPHVMAQVLRDSPPQQLLNGYGPSEGTTFTTTYRITALSPEVSRIPIGRPIANTRVYLLDTYGQPVPQGVTGEIYIGGDGVACGYLNRPELTAERFLPDPFSDKPDARLYRTGDLARYLPDGNLEFLGRNDQQVKIRGFRIELGEIEARLLEYPFVSEAVVQVMGDGQDKRLIAYVVTEADEELVNRLHTHLSTILPDYMVPTAFVRLDTFPLTPNGKLDRRALPAPGEEAFARQVYEAPQGETEILLAAIWSELLGIEQISRHDSFFALGGHSLLAVRMIERLRNVGLTLAVRDLFQSPMLSAFAQTVGQSPPVVVPANVITPATTALTPEMLPLIELTQLEIDHIVGQVPGGMANIQDIYALSPLQDGILFHHLLANEGDPYLLVSQMTFDDRALLDRYLAAVQQVVNRHDILRTAFVWQGLSTPAQVVWRQAPLSVTKLTLDPVDGPVRDQLAQLFDPRRYRIDLQRAPLLHFVVAQEEDGRWSVLQLLHHLIGDHTTMEVMHGEVQAYLVGQEENLPVPVPFRNLVAQVRLGVSQAEHTRFFTDMLAEVDEPTLPFGLTEVHRDGSQVTESHRMLPVRLNDRLRNQARRLGVSLATLCHLAWAQVLSRTSGQDKVVFGTVLFGRMQAGQGGDSSMGLFINTLPLRLDMDDTPVQESVRAAHSRLAGLLEHEHASLALAQRCSGIPGEAPLFSALLNYRHSAQPVTTDATISGIEFLGGQERTNYPFVLSVEDVGHALGLTAQIAQPIDPERICDYMQQALESLAVALEQHPEIPVRTLNILPTAEKKLLLETWNATETSYPDHGCIHQLFEQWAEKSPDATALVYEEQSFSYAELNNRANRLAHQLIALGVIPDQRVAVCVSRSLAMVVGVLAVLKAGGAYVPLDPVYTGERLTHILTDAAPAILLADNVGRDVLGEDALAGLTVLDPNSPPDQPDSNPQVPALTAQHLAYVIYTSGSTGTPKGVMVEHRHILRLFEATEFWYHFNRQDIWCLFHSIAFDFSVWELWGALRYGAKLVLVPHAIARSPQELHQFVCQHGITVLNQTPSAFKAFIASYIANPLPDCLRYIIFGGEALDPSILKPWYALREETLPQLVNMYGITETTVHVTYRALARHDVEQITSPIGTRIPDLTLYLLDKYSQPVPLGAVGELYIGGAGVARGYLNRPELTAERFLPDPFSSEPDARMYRTGDLARYLPDGNLAFLGRNDQQVKIRGFRIEPGEIEARLTEHPAVHEAVVQVMGGGQDKRLVAYVVAEVDKELINRLRTHLGAILPDYMVPAAFVCMDAFPLTPNGKLDRRALPVPGENAFARQVYAAPQGETETLLATIWSELLGIEQVSRHDNFFALGGHSLLAVRMIERLRNAGLTLAVRDLFQSPVLSAFAQTAGQSLEVVVPTNVITPVTTALTPEMLPLADLTQSEIDHIIAQVSGGVANIQDIYGLSPLQDGILFHHLLANKGDPYLLAGQMVFANRDLLDNYLAAVQQVVNRHDILRTAFVWQGLSAPVQVVWRQAQLSVTELTLDPVDGLVCDQLAQHFDPRRYRIDLQRAPLLHFAVAQEDDGRWSALQLQHHLIGDHTTMEVMQGEIQAYLAGQEENLPVPVPFRNLVAQARLGVSQAAHTRFFTDMLSEVDEPTLPFGLMEVHRDGSQVMESHQMLTPELNDRLRSQARRMGVSLATLCHLAWAQVLSRTSGQVKVVFGTVLFGRMQAGQGADNGMGLFTNTLPLRLDMDDTPVRDGVRLAHTRLAELLEHEHASLALAQRCSEVPRETPLFSALLNYRHSAQPVTTDVTISGIEFLSGQERTNYPLVLSVEDFGHALGLTVQIVQPIDPKRVCGYMQQALESLAAALEQQPETPVRLLNILPEAEKRLLLATWNATQAPYPDQSCIHRLFEQQAENTPNAIALVYGKHILNYAELNARANQLAHWLIGQGVKPDNRVAVLLERSVELVVAQLAILKAGAVYVPIDPRVPDERKYWLISDCSAKLLLTDTPIDLAIPRFCLADEMGAIRQEDNRNPDLPRSSTELAYIMYTSGSTGTPKGVMVPHRAVVRLVINNGYAEIGPDDRVAFEANPAFDASTFEVWSPLLNGGVLVVIDHATLLMPKELVQALQTHRITVLWLSVGLFNRLAAELSPAFPQLKILIVGGDVLDPHVIRQVLRDNPPQQLLNGYGPSEGTTFTTTYRITALSPEVVRIPIGRPIANTRVYLLDTYGHPVPQGAIGEIYIGGDGVVCGYLNRPELTKERFLPDPFSDEPNARLYRTGDLARYLPDGNLEFLGRNDQQVKIRGFRIEPGEIEAQLLKHPAVSEALVLTLGNGQDKRLVAYVVAEADEMLVNHLRTHLSMILPDYMVPAAFVRLDTFPLTPNGKLDRRALPVPGEEDFARQIYAAPLGEMETLLATIWCELLGVERISRYDNFFVLGGHSLLAVRMMNRIAALGIEWPLSTLFTFPVLTTFAEAISAQFGESDRILPAIVPLSREGQLPLSFAQQRLWFLTQFDGVSETYHIPLALRLHGRLDIAAWQQTLDTLFARHEALRSVFVAVDGQPQIELLPAASGLLMRKYDLRDMPDVDAQLASLSAQEIETLFDLARGPLIRSSLIQLADDDHVFLLTLHHIVFDGWSVSVLMRELSSLYTAFLAGQPDPLPPLTIQYPDYAAWQRQWLSAERIQSQSDYWRARLVDAPVLLDLPTDRPRPLQQSFAGALLPVSLDAELTQSLKRLSEQQGVTLFMTLLAAWATVLSRLSGQEDLVIGTPSAGRGRQEVESLIGFFVNTLALRMDLSDAPNVTELLARVRQTALAAQEHQDLPFEQVVEIMQLPRQLAHTPLFQVMFAWQNNENTEWRLPGLEVSPVEQVFDVAKFDLELNLFEVEGQIVGYLNYATALFDQATIERQVCYLHTVLRGMVANPQQPVGKIDILTVAERKLLLETWNATEMPYPAHCCIHRLFEQQAEKSPDATALMYAGQVLSYAELNARANRLAHQLIMLGVAPEQRVAICVASSPARIVGLLAVLKAGGAYVPLDPAYPGERLVHILTDAVPAIVLADNTGRTALGEKVLAALTVLDPNSLPDQPDSNPQVSAL
ncbi:amino acid adenylation domain-containing protein, partial [Photorhabdus sp. S14-60]|uniref:amino acid adenylation domain-containing protein n=1 Tax=Photorhabdus sp. S14-60 TaxID=2029689 RepID=UPI00404092D3